ncbi:hypothetical protein X729_25185 [Mesorhizobium sp. L103C131B0]|nr:hypothetical protein X729_25185 [Mesorhizobium sp. L103C131B0]
MVKWLGQIECVDELSEVLVRLPSEMACGCFEGGNCMLDCARAIWNWAA